MNPLDCKISIDTWPKPQSEIEALLSRPDYLALWICVLDVKIYFGVKLV